MVIAINKEEELQGWVLADGRSVALKGSSSYFDFLFDLFACYYAWDKQYPNCFPVLHFFQDHMLLDQHTFYKATKYKMFEKEYSSTSTNTSDNAS